MDDLTPEPTRQTKAIAAQCTTAAQEIVERIRQILSLNHYTYYWYNDSPVMGLTLESAREHLSRAPDSIRLILDTPASFIYNRAIRMAMEKFPEVFGSEFKKFVVYEATIQAKARDAEPFLRFTVIAEYAK